MRIKQGTILSKPTCVRQISTYEQRSLVCRSEPHLFTHIFLQQYILTVVSLIAVI